MKVTVVNRGKDTAEIHVLPTYGSVILETQQQASTS
jgi:hypothetical protein